MSDPRFILHLKAEVSNVYYLSTAKSSNVRNLLLTKNTVLEVLNWDTLVLKIKTNLARSSYLSHTHTNCFDSCKYEFIINFGKFCQYRPAGFCLAPLFPLIEVCLRVDELELNTISVQGGYATRYSSSGFLCNYCLQLFSGDTSIHWSHDPSMETREDSPTHQWAGFWV